MFYLITSILLLVAMLVGFLFTLHADRKIEDDHVDTDIDAVNHGDMLR